MLNLLVCTVVKRTSDTYPFSVLEHAVLIHRCPDQTESFVPQGSKNWCNSIGRRSKILSGDLFGSARQAHTLYSLIRKRMRRQSAVCGCYMSAPAIAHQAYSIFSCCLSVHVNRRYSHAMLVVISGSIKKVNIAYELSACSINRKVDAAFPFLIIMSSSSSQLTQIGRLSKRLHIDWRLYVRTIRTLDCDRPWLIIINLGSFRNWQLRDLRHLPSHVK